jgi:hypothetical protein
MKSGKPRKMAKESYEKLKPKQNDQEKLPQETQCMLSPLDKHYHVSSLNHPISQSSTNFVHITLPLWQ